jgi:hypothetical protein
MMTLSSLYRFLTTHLVINETYKHMKLQSSIAQLNASVHDDLPHIIINNYIIFG